MNVNYEEKISHLSNKEINILMERYYSGEKNDLLIDEYSIDIRSSLLYKTFPMKFYENKMCQFCEIPMASYRQSKSNNSKASLFCIECSHEYDNYYCKCNNCQEYRRKQTEIKGKEEKLINDKKRQIILNEYLFEIDTPVNIEKLTLKNKLYTCALLRTSLSETLDYIKPDSESTLTLSPTNQYKIKIISDLKKENILAFSPSTLLNSVLIENDQIKSYYPLDTTFKLNIKEEDYEERIIELLHLRNILEIDNELKLEIWYEIGLYESLEFLYAKMDEYNLPTNSIGDKTISAIKESLKNFSISQNFNFIWRAVKNAAAFYQKDNVSRAHAVNTISGAIQRSHEKALAEEWQIKGYGRDYNYAQTVISEIFFNNVLKIGDKGFESKPY